MLRRTDVPTHFPFPPPFYDQRFYLALEYSESRFVSESRRFPFSSFFRLSVKAPPFIIQFSNRERNTRSIAPLTVNSFSFDENARLLSQEACACENDEALINPATPFPFEELALSSRAREHQLTIYPFTSLPFFPSHLPLCFRLMKKSHDFVPPPR